MRWCAASIYKAPLISSYRGLSYSDPFGLCTVLDFADCKFITVSLSLGGGFGGKFKAGPVQGEAKALVLEAKGTLALGGEGFKKSGKLDAKLYSISGRAGPFHGGYSSGCSVGTDGNGECKNSATASIGASGNSGAVSAKGSATFNSTSVGVGARLGIVSGELDVDVIQGTMAAIGATVAVARDVWNFVRTSAQRTLLTGDP